MMVRNLNILDLTIFFHVCAHIPLSVSPINCINLYNLLNNIVSILKRNWCLQSEHLSHRTPGQHLPRYSTIQTILSFIHTSHRQFSSQPANLCIFPDRKCHLRAAGVGGYDHMRKLLVAPSPTRTLTLVNMIHLGNITQHIKI